MPWRRCRRDLVCPVKRLYRAIPRSGGVRAAGSVALVLVVAAIFAVPAAGLVGPQATGGADAPVAGDASPQVQANETNETQQFDLDADVVERCGLQCRTVTANLTNQENETARNVTAEIHISAGQRQVWHRTIDVGNVSGNASVERSANISVGPRDAYNIHQNRGRVSILATVRWDGGTEVFTERRKVV